MQITPESLLAEAGRMALELRLKDQALATLQADNQRLQARLSEFERATEPGEADRSNPGHAGTVPEETVRDGR